MNNRKIPIAFFIFGVIQCLIRFFVIGAIGLICLVVGLISQSIALEVGALLIIGWILIAVIDEVRVCHTIKTDSSNSEVNEIFDSMFGEDELMKKVLDEGKDVTKDIIKEMKNHQKGDDKSEE